MTDDRAREEAERIAVVDRHGDVWTPRPDGLWETAETAPFPWEHIARKWGPLRAARPVAVSAEQVYSAYNGARSVPFHPGEDVTPDGLADWRERSKVFAMLEALGITVEPTP